MFNSNNQALTCVSSYLRLKHIWMQVQLSSLLYRGEGERHPGWGPCTVINIWHMFIHAVPPPHYTLSWLCSHYTKWGTEEQRDQVAHSWQVAEPEFEPSQSGSRHSSVKELVQPLSNLRLCNKNHFYCKSSHWEDAEYLRWLWLLGSPG